MIAFHKDTGAFVRRRFDPAFISVDIRYGGWKAEKYQLLSSEIEMIFQNDGEHKEAKKKQKPKRLEMGKNAKRTSTCSQKMQILFRQFEEIILQLLFQKKKKKNCNCLNLPILGSLYLDVCTHYPLNEESGGNSLTCQKLAAVLAFLTVHKKSFLSLHFS